VIHVTAHTEYFFRGSFDIKNHILVIFLFIDTQHPFIGAVEGNHKYPLIFLSDFQDGLNWFEELDDSRLTGVALGLPLEDIVLESHEDCFCVQTGCLH